MKVLGIAGSPRLGGNSEILLDRFLEGARAAGAETVKISVCEKKIEACPACGACRKGEFCPLEDEMPSVLAWLMECDAVAIASPVYFSGLPSRLKALVDRCQPLWVEKYLLGKKRRKRKGYFLSTAARRSPETFVGILQTVKALFFTLDLEWNGEILAGGLDERGEILSHPEFLEEAARLGVESTKGL